MNLTTKALTIVLLWGLLGVSGTSQARSRKHRSNPIRTALDAAMVSMPEDNEVCFAPDEPCAAKLAKFIGSAKKSLEVAIYDLNEEQIVHAILARSNEIPVRIVVDRRQSKEKNSAVGKLKRAGVKVRFGTQRGIMHHKFTIVDGARIETGSFNYTFHAHTANQENQLYLSAPRVLERYRSRFEKMWETAHED